MTYGTEYGMEYPLHWLTVLLSVAAVAWAIYLIPLSGRVRAWLWLSAAFALLATERVFEMLAHGGILLTEKNNEIVSDLLHLFATAGLLTGIICIRKIFLEYRTSRQQVGQQLDELQRFQRVSVGRELRMKELQAQQRTSQGTHVVTDEGQPCADRDAAQERTALLFMLEDLARSQQLNEHAQQEWMATVDALRDPMFLHDAEFRVIRANRAYAMKAGKSFKEIIGQPYYEIFPKAAAALPCCLRAMQSFREEKDEEEVAVGESIYRSRAFTVKDPQGAYLYSVHTLEEITERKRAEARLAEQVEELRRWHEATLGRETRVLELKREVNELLGSAGSPPRYPSAEVEPQEA